MKKFKDLNLKAIRETCELDFAHFTYQRGMCSCCYGPKDLPKIYWKNSVIPDKEAYYEGSEDNSNTYQYLLFKNADNGSGCVTGNSIIKHQFIEWGFPYEKLDTVCSMLQQQLGDEYEVIKPSDSRTCIEIKLKEK